MKEKDLTGYCGLYCGDCIRYQCRASHLADKLLVEIDNHHFREYANVKRVHAKEFEDFDSLINSLKAISRINCMIPCGLGGDGCGGSCRIINCVKKKKLNGCWECDDFENCENLDFLKHFHGQSIINNLRKINKHGIPKWVEYRDKCYPWL